MKKNRSNYELSEHRDLRGGESIRETFSPDKYPYITFTEIYLIRTVLSKKLFTVSFKFNFIHHADHILTSVRIMPPVVRTISEFSQSEILLRIRLEVNMFLFLSG